MSAMTVRLTQAETKLRDANSKNAAQAGEIKQLRERIGAFELDRTARKQAEGAGAGASAGTHERRYARMQAKIHQMETFLADYGMIWVGGDDDDYSDTESDDAAAAAAADEATTTAAAAAAAAAAAPQATWAPGASVPAEPAVPEIQYTKIIQNVEELNQLAGEGVGQVVRRADGSSHIKMPDPVALRLYRNGVMMFDGPFRPFETEATQRLIRDLTDGYFPGELQERYPDGSEDAGSPHGAFHCEPCPGPNPATRWPPSAALRTQDLAAACLSRFGSSGLPPNPLPPPDPHLPRASQPRSRSTTCAPKTTPRPGPAPSSPAGPTCSAVRCSSPRRRDRPAPRSQPSSRSPAPSGRSRTAITGRSRPPRRTRC